MKEKKKLSFETLAIHAGQNPDPLTGAIMTPLYMSSTFVQESPGKHKGYEYSRTSNPTRKAFESCMASLEEGDQAFAVSSGCAAISLVLHLLKPGDHVIATDDLYGGTVRLFNEVFSKQGIHFTYKDLTQIENFKKGVQKNTKMVWIESPSNPLLKLADIQEISNWAKKKNILVVVDNTFMTPYFQRPLFLGADIVVHSTTKFINGHSDLIGGVVVAKGKKLSEKLFFLSNSMGPIQSVFDSYVILRSLKTLAIRMKTHEENAKALAAQLSNHKKVSRLIYPMAPYHPQYKLAKKQMSGSGAMMTFFIKGGLQASKQFLRRLKIFSLAESLGGVESLVTHPSLMTHASLPPGVRKQLGINDSMIRLSVGLEGKEDLIEDICSALDF